MIVIFMNEDFSNNDSFVFVDGEVLEVLPLDSKEGQLIQIIDPDENKGSLIRIKKPLSI